MSNPTDVAMANSMATAWSPGTFCDHVVAIELIYEILKHLDGVGEPKSNLLSVALANKHFSKPALDVMWAQMHSLTPFLALLPHDTTTIGNKTTRILRINAPAPSGAPFTMYANRLRVLKFGDKSPSDNIPSLSLCRLGCIYGLNHIFPGLRSVSFNSYYVSQPLAMHAILVLPSAITKLEFNGLHEETATFTAMLAFFSCQFSGTLKELTLELPIPARPLGMQSLQFLLNFQALTALSITCQYKNFPIFDLMGWVLGLETLHVLKIDVCPAPELFDHFGNSPAASAISSSNLHRLSICGPVTFIDCILPLFRRKGVREVVTLSSSQDISAEEVEQIIVLAERLFPAPAEVVWMHTEED